MLPWRALCLALLLLPAAARAQDPENCLLCHQYHGLSRYQRDPNLPSGGRLSIFGLDFGSRQLGVLNRLPASYFVSVSYMCWAFRRQGVKLAADGSIADWLY